ncbi:hypothetical protein CBS101457_000673 [Exobasidium rhododendri]|nr:hypothetical protein CBS101457_000673 [Exobasidium rhododendri]
MPDDNARASTSALDTSPGLRQASSSESTSTRPQSLSSVYRPRSAFSFPRAAQPEIVRAYQKDAYYRELLQTQVQDVVRSLLGSRALFAHANMISFLGSVTYFTLSTLGGAQTLGEEYVNSMMTEGKTGRIVGLRRRIAFILFHIVSPFLASRAYSAVRRRIVASDQLRGQVLHRARLRAAAVASRQQNGQQQTSKQPQASVMDRLLGWLATRLPSLESVNSSDGLLTYLSAAHLALFYLGGKYYSVGQRMSGTRYISTISRRPGAKPPSYEVLGFLLGIQLLVKALLRANKWRIEFKRAKEEKATATVLAEKEDGEERHGSTKTVKAKQYNVVTIDTTQWSHQTSPPTKVPSKKERRQVPLTFPDPDALPSAQDLGLPSNVDRNLLEAARKSSKIRAAELESISESLLKCTLCMERREPQKGTSAVTECGHVFCWDCIVGWSKEKPECPLCRQSLNPSHLLPIYNF